ncbi:MAG: nucleotidyl transferase AbiEii/AbiGii toxin family protein [Deltaproteobacteria bacterium]|nr:nucleotidyl transferase AbiEii/AbiGii toxin family protein [Deltaproteobacteria bacterium]
MAAILKNPFLRELPPQTYLAGGTAVALHLGHRLSIDLDFFTPHDLDSLQWFQGLQTFFPGDFTVSAVKIEKNTRRASAAPERVPSFRRNFLSCYRMFGLS